MWFSFDGCSFETHETEESARSHAEEAMNEWSQDARGLTGWDELSTQVCYGKITHAVSVETQEINDENRHMAHSGIECFETHTLEQIVPDTYRCLICGGVVSFDGTKPGQME